MEKANDVFIMGISAMEKNITAALGAKKGGSRGLLVRVLACGSRRRGFDFR